MVEELEPQVAAAGQILSCNRRGADFYVVWFHGALTQERKKKLARNKSSCLSGSSVLSTLANADQSIPTLSSVAVLARSNSKAALPTGDARGDHMVSDLEKARLLTNGRLHVDLLKVQHHGGNRNATKTFFKYVTADK